VRKAVIRAPNSTQLNWQLSCIVLGALITPLVSNSI